MNTETSILITNSVNSTIQNNEVIKDNFSFLNEKDKSAIKYTNTGHHPIAVEMFSVMALFRKITAIMGGFEQFSRDIAMKLSQSFSQEDFSQMLAAFKKKIEGINDMYNVNWWAAIGQATLSVGALVGGGIAHKVFKAEAFGINVGVDIANSTGGKLIDLCAVTPRNNATIKETTADYQSQAVRFFSEVWEKAGQWWRQMSEMFAETNRISVQVFQNLTQSFSTLF